MTGAKTMAVLFIAICHLFAADSRSLANIQGGAGLRDQILSNDYGVAKAALDENRAKKNTRLVCLSLKNPSLMIKTQAAEVLKEFRVKSSLPCLIEALENNQVIFTGGTETQILQEQLNSTIVLTLERLTGLTLKTKPTLSDAEIKQVIQRAKRWWAAYRRR